MILTRGADSQQVYYRRDGEAVFCDVLGPNGCICEAGKEWRLFSPVWSSLEWQNLSQTKGREDSVWRLWAYKMDKPYGGEDRRSFSWLQRRWNRCDWCLSIASGWNLPFSWIWFWQILIVLPLQERALKNSNSAFIDRNSNAYPDQWEFVSDFVRDILELEYNV